MRPAPLVAHADWSKDARKRWLAAATPDPRGRYTAGPPIPVGPLETLLDRLLRAAGDRSVLLGLDFPIGLPRAYAARAGITHFVAALRRFPPPFFNVAATPAEISIARPFYPLAPGPGGAASRAQLLEGLGLEQPGDLLRRCERARPDRPAACSLFWTLGGNQVGKAAITGWRDLLAPALRAGRDPAIWPFEGRLPELLARHRMVIAETYPAEACRHLGLRLQTTGGKRRQTARRLAAVQLLCRAADAGVTLEPELEVAVCEGFGDRADGEDRFDATIGLLGMLEVVLGRRPAGEPADPSVRAVEGWILGQQPAEEGA